MTDPDEPPKDEENSGEWNEWRLGQETEFRFEVDFDKTVFVKLTSGTAEIFGAEIPVNRELEFSGRKLAIFTYHGCSIAVRGKPTVEYVAEETPMASYLNVHLALQQQREAVAPSKGFGPRVMIVGPSDVGKTTLATLLLNYAVRSDAVPLLTDLDTNEGTITLPGCLAAAPVTKVIDPEDGYGAPAATTSLAPVSLYYGQASPLDRQRVYNRQVKVLGGIVQRKLEADQDVRSSGVIINTPSEFAEAAGKDILSNAIEAFKVDVLLVIGNDRLHSELSRKYSKSISVIKLNKSGGVVSRDKAYRRQMQHRAVREYFYGTPKNELLPYSTTLSFADAAVRRIGSAPSYLTLAAEREKLESKMMTVDPSDILLSFVLAVSTVDAPSEKSPAGPVATTSEDDESDALTDGIIMGFVYMWVFFARDLWRGRQA